MLHRISPWRWRAVVAFALLALAGAACSSGGTTIQGTTPIGSEGGSCSPSSSPVVTFAAYSNVYDVYGKLQSTFASDWKDQHDQSVIFQSSYGGSTTQAQNIVNGFPADIFAASLDPDVQMVQQAGLVTGDWQHAPDASIVGTSAGVFDVRPGNPKHLENWNDLTPPGLQLLTPDPAK